MHTRTRNTRVLGKLSGKKTKNHKCIARALYLPFGGIGVASTPNACWPINRSTVVRWWFVCTKVKITPIKNQLITRLIVLTITSHHTVIDFSEGRSGLGRAGRDFRCRFCANDSISIFFGAFVCFSRRTVWNLIFRFLYLMCARCIAVAVVRLGSRSPVYRLGAVHVLWYVSSTIRIRW